MRIVVLSYCNSLATDVIRRIHGRHPITAIVRVVWQAPTSRSTRSARLRATPVAALHHGLQRRVENWQHRQRMARVARLLSSQTPSLPQVPIMTMGSRELHTATSLSKFAGLAPDVLIVSHAPLLKPALFQLPAVAALNIHWGVAPTFCGEHTLFWPLYFRDYLNVGVTIHRIDAGVDTGPILAQGFPALCPQDDEFSVLARCAGIAAHLVGDVLDAAAAGDPLNGWQSDAAGRQFLRRDRRFIHDLRYWARRSLLRERLPVTAARRELFLVDSGRSLAAVV